MSARSDTLELMRNIFNATGIFLDFDDVNTLRRAELTLQRWAELECGDGNGFIERDEQTNIPRYCNTRSNYLDPHDPRMWHRIPDREAGALRRVKAVCEAHGLHFYHQTDPRGCALYVSNKPLPDNNYTSGIPCRA